ncbi:helix-turn-helix transcriptional regulator [Evansella sp. AB-P1]|uniref:helix-turn-helix domain-containing protein n=1 Tax=Evansella sp. AB-P1 TaxID=3037653 RepID=UPI00241D1DEB|nr:helix-turn-helix transcriptional regulator [Evansella sp. AB-P1]MDG5787806.1 helix-turn-helix transcriptional regulator [Evansella sp. AB-P1]
MSIGNRIRTLRKKNGFTQKDLADKVKVSPQVISNWERGYTSPDHNDVENLADSLSCSTEYLHGRSDNPEVNKKAAYNPINEINTILDELGIEDIFFHDMDAWKNFTPEDVEELRKHFEWVSHKAKERNKDA